MHYMKYARSDLSGLLPAWLSRLLSPWRARRYYYGVPMHPKKSD
jgi:hypothetical protein